MSTDTGFMSKQERVTELLREGLEGMFSSNDRYKEYLDVVAKFPSYSANNKTLIFNQFPEATKLMGYTQWNKLDRRLKKDMKGILIKAPNYKNVQEKQTDKKGRPIYGRDGKQMVEVKKALTGFSPVTVFDVSQTYGKELPEPADFVSKIQSGSSEVDFKRLYSVLKMNMIEDAEILVTDNQMVAEFEERESLKGYYKPEENSIVIRPDLTNIEKFKTLIHEYTHSLLYTPNGPYADDSKEEKDILAESVAYCASKYYGLETDDYTIGYSATWTKDMDIATEGLNKIQETFATLVRQFDEVILENEHVLTSSDKQVNDQKIIGTEESYEHKKLDRSESSTLLSGDVGKKHVTTKDVPDTSSADIAEKYRPIFAETIPDSTLNNLRSILSNEEPAHFQALNTQSLEFSSVQFIQIPGTDDFEVKLDSNEIISNEQFITDYIVTNELSNGKDINIGTVPFNEQFSIELGDRSSTITIDLKDGNTYKVMSCSNPSILDFTHTKEEYDRLSFNKIENHVQCVNTLMSRIDVAMNKEIRSSLNTSYRVVSSQLTKEEAQTVERRLSDIVMPHDKNSLFVMSEYLRKYGTISSLSEFQERLSTNNEELAKNLGMKNGTYNFMVSNAIDIVAKHNLEVISGEVKGKETYKYETSYLLGVLESDIKMLEILEDVGNIEEKADPDKLTISFVKTILDQKGLNGFEIDEYTKVMNHMGAPQYILNVQNPDNGEKGKLLIADENGNIPYIAKRNTLEKVLQVSSGLKQVAVQEKTDEYLKQIESQVSNDTEKKYDQQLSQADSEMEL